MNARFCLVLTEEFQAPVVGCGRCGKGREIRIRSGRPVVGRCGGECPEPEIDLLSAMELYRAGAAYRAARTAAPTAAREARREGHSG